MQKRNLKLLQAYKDAGKLFYDGDEPLLRPFVEGCPSINSISFGVQENNDLRIAEVEFTEQGSVFRVEGTLNEEMSYPSV